MKLGDLLTAESKIKEEKLIGRELDILEGEMLLLAIQKGDFFVEGEEGVAPATRLLALFDPLECNEENEEDGWGGGLWDDEFEPVKEATTNRQAILNERVDFEPELLDVSEFIINNKYYAVYEAEESWLDGRPHDTVQALIRADGADIIPERWQEKTLEELTMAEYIVQDEMMDIAWDADILSIDVEFTDENETGEILSGKLIKCPCGRLDVPVTFELKAPSGKDITVNVYGTYTLDIWQDADALGLDKDELEEICAPTERLLVVEYSADTEVLLNFYTRDFLDEEARMGDILPEIMLGMQDHELRLVDVVHEDFDEDVELELMSYEVFED